MYQIIISTHTPLAGCDKTVITSVGVLTVFQLTHPSRGATIETLVTFGKINIFQLTHPSRGATGYAYF